MRRAFFLCSRTLRLSSNVKSNLNPLLNNKLDYIPKFPLVAFPSSNFSLFSSGNDSSIEKPDASNDNELDLRPETDLDVTENTKETAIMDVEDVDNKELKSKLEDYLHKQKEGSLYKANDLVQKRLASSEFFNMDDKKWDEMIKEATEKGFLADMRECEEILEDMKSWDKLLPDEIKKKVEAKFEEISDRVEKGELEVEEGYELFKEFKDTMVKECMDMMDARFELVGKRYHSGRDELTIVSERFEHREENRKDCLRTLFNLIEEAGKANKMVEDALTSHLKDQLTSNPHFMKRLNAKKTGILASKAGNFLPWLSSSSSSSSVKSSARPYSTTSIYMNRSFPRSNSSFNLCSGNVLRSEVLRLGEELFLVDAGLGTPRICKQDELTKVPMNRATTRFENKVGTLDLVAGGELLIKEHILKRFFIDLVAGESLIKERATAKFNDLVGSTDVVVGEPLVLLPRRLRQNLVWMELNKIWRRKRKVNGLLFKRVRGGFTVYIAGFVAFLPFRFRRLKGRWNNQFTIESIKGKLGRNARCRITLHSR